MLAWQETFHPLLTHKMSALSGLSVTHGAVLCHLLGSGGAAAVIMVPSFSDLPCAWM